MTTAYDPILNDTGDEHTNVFLTPEDAIKFVKRVRKVRFFVTTKCFLYKDKPDEEGKGGRGFDVDDRISVSAAQFTDLLEQKMRFNNLKKERSGEGDMFVRITRLGSCVFI